MVGTVLRHRSRPCRPRAAKREGPLDMELVVVVSKVSEVREMIG
jgi:hypothetical protein